MKCKYALKYLGNDSISVRVKENIDAHISQCAFCQGQIISNKKVGEFISKLPSVERNESFWKQMMREIRTYREKKLEKWWQRLSDFLPLEPAARRTAFVGIACSAILVVIAAVYVPVYLENGTNDSQTNADADFFLREHSLSQDMDIFDHSGIPVVFVSSAEIQDHPDKKK